MNNYAKYQHHKKNLMFLEKSQNCILYTFLRSKNWGLQRNIFKLFFYVIEPVDDKLWYQICSTLDEILQHTVRTGPQATDPPPYLSMQKLCENVTRSQSSQSGCTCYTNKRHFIYDWIVTQVTRVAFYMTE